MNIRFPYKIYLGAFTPNDCMEYGSQALHHFKGRHLFSWLSRKESKVSLRSLERFHCLYRCRRLSHNRLPDIRFLLQQEWGETFTTQGWRSTGLSHPTNDFYIAAGSGCQETGCLGAAIELCREPPQDSWHRCPPCSLTDAGRNPKLGEHHCHATLANYGIQWDVLD
jgi:hypothetical protein